MKFSRTLHSAEYKAGYTDGVRACLKLLAKCFFMKNKDAKACRDEMQELLK